jgi:hypothetical protein
MQHTLHFSSSKCRLFHNATFFGSCIIHILYTGVLKFKRKFRHQRVKDRRIQAHINATRNHTHNYETRIQTHKNATRNHTHSYETRIQTHINATRNHTHSYETSIEAHINATRNHTHANATRTQTTLLAQFNESVTSINLFRTRSLRKVHKINTVTERQ